MDELQQNAAGAQPNKDSGQPAPDSKGISPGSEKFLHLKKWTGLTPKVPRIRIATNGAPLYVDGDNPYFNVFSEAQQRGYAVTCERGAFVHGDQAFTARFTITRNGGDKHDPVQSAVLYGGSLDRGADIRSVGRVAEFLARFIEKAENINIRMPIVIPNIDSSGTPAFLAVLPGENLHAVLTQSNLQKPTSFRVDKDRVTFLLPDGCHWFSTSLSNWREELEARYSSGRKAPPLTDK